MNRTKRVLCLWAGLWCLLSGPLLAQNLLQDPSFEAGVPNAYWNEMSTNYGTPLCDAASCGTGNGTALPRTGTWFAWFGGNYGNNEIGSIDQDVVLPAGAAITLEFYLWTGSWTVGGTDYTAVYVDGTQVWSTGETDPAYQAGYALVMVDLSAYGDGASHNLKLEGTDLSGGNTNMSVDDLSLTAVAPEPYISGVSFTDYCFCAPPRYGDGVLDPGEDAELVVTLTNPTGGGIAAITGTLSCDSPYVTIVDGAAAFPNVAAGGSTANTAEPFRIKLSGNAACGSLEFTLTIDGAARRQKLNLAADGQLAIGKARATWVDSFSLDVGAPFPLTTATPSTDIPKSIPDNNLSGVDSIITIADTALVSKVTITLSITHTYDADLDIFLVGPNGLWLELSTDNGGNGDNYTNTTFDDAAATAITAGAAPFTGAFRPESPLSAFTGIPANGTWILRVVDDAGGDLGTLTAWTLTLTTDSCATTPCGLRVAGLTTQSSCACTPAAPPATAVQPGETATVRVLAENAGLCSLTGIQATLSSTSPYVGVLTDTAAYPDLAAGAQAVNALPDFEYWVDPLAPCGTELPLVVHFTAAEGEWIETISQVVGEYATTTETLAAADVPVPIPDDGVRDTQRRDPYRVPGYSTITVSGTGTVLDVDVNLSITHTWDSDLDIFLVGPDGTRVELSTDNGSSGDNYTDTTFDDAAATAIIAGAAPFTGTFRPETPLAALNGIPANGIWQLEVGDDLGGDVGTLTAWSLILTTGAYQCTVCDSALACAATATPSSGAPPLAVSFEAEAGVDCAVDKAAVSYLWVFGDGYTSTQRNVVHTYANAGTYSWSLTVTLGATTCTAQGVIEVRLAFDLVFQDDQGRSQWCINSHTGEFRYTDFLAPAIYTGVGQLIYQPGNTMFFMPSPLTAYVFELIHDMDHFRANGFIRQDAWGIRSFLYDLDTTDDPPACLD